LILNTGAHMKHSTTVTGSAPLRKLAFFEGLSDIEIASLLDQSQLQEIADGDVLFDTGNTIENVYIVTSGNIYLCVKAPRGAMCLIQVVESGCSFGIAEMLTGQPASFAALAPADGEVILIPKKALLAAMASNEALLSNLMTSVCTQIYVLYAAYGDELAMPYGMGYSSEARACEARRTAALPRHM